MIFFFIFTIVDSDICHYIKFVVLASDCRDEVVFFTSGILINGT